MLHFETLQNDTNAENKPDGKISKIIAFLTRGKTKKGTIMKNRLKTVSSNGAVFGNSLEEMPLYSDLPPADPNNHSVEQSMKHGLPEFVVRCIQKIETMITKVGLYRINGSVQAIKRIK